MPARRPPRGWPGSCMTGPRPYGTMRGRYGPADLGGRRPVSSSRAGASSPPSFWPRLARKSPGATARGPRFPPDPAWKHTPHRITPPVWARKRRPVWGTRPAPPRYYNRCSRAPRSPPSQGGPASSCSAPVRLPGPPWTSSAPFPRAAPSFVASDYTQPGPALRPGPSPQPLAPAPRPGPTPRAVVPVTPPRRCYARLRIGRAGPRWGVVGRRVASGLRKETKDVP